jgi:hypothetical protein
MWVLYINEKHAKYTQWPTGFTSSSSSSCKQCCIAMQTIKCEVPQESILYVFFHLWLTTLSISVIKNKLLPGIQKP